VLAERDAALPAVSTPAAGAREQRPLYLETVTTLLGLVAADLAPRADEVRGLSVTGTSGSMVPCDDRGRPTGAALLYNDQQSDAEAARLRQAGIEATAASPMARIGHLVSLGADLVLHTPDVVHAGLLGHVPPADTSHALKAGIDPLLRTWNHDALAALDVPGEAVPELVHPGTVLGDVTAEVCELTGLPTGVLVVAGMTDGCTAQVAAGAVSRGDSVGVLGTTLVLKAVAGHDVHGLGGALYSHYAPAGSWWAGGASNVGARPVTEEYGGTSTAALTRLERDAAAVGPSPFVSYPLRGTGERFPFSRPGATGFTLGRPADRATAYRTFLEGVAFVERIALDTLRAHGVTPRLHHLAGGGSRSELWSRLRATVIDVPVVRAHRASSAYGAALIALAAVEETPLPDLVARTLPTDSQPLVEPLEDERDRLLESLHRLRDELGRRGLLDPVPEPRPV
jgi:xylulokinase